MPNPGPPLYRGWWRANRRKPWLALSAANTEDDCWRDLLYAVEMRRLHGGDSCVRASADGPPPDARQTR
jgi:hypothetical protein